MVEQKKSYEMPGCSLPGISIEDKLSDLESLAVFLNCRGIETKNTRIDRYQKYLRAVLDCGIEKLDPVKVFKNVSDSRFQHGLDWYLYVLREVDELAHILKGLKVHVPDGVDDRLCKVVAGADFAALDKNSESRNIQFELRIASYFCLSGFVVDLSTETDIVAFKGRRHFYIECKRVSNAKQLEENILKAKQQILARMPKRKGILDKCYGVIALDVTRVAYSHNGLTMGVTNEHARDVVQDALRGISSKIGHVNFFSKKPPIIQCWLQIHIPGLTEHPPQAFTRFSSMFLTNPEVAFGCKAALSLLHRATAGLDLADPREHPPKKLSTRLDLPAGTELWLDPDISEVFAKASDSELYKNLNMKEVQGFDDVAKKNIGGMLVQGEKYCFSMLDLVTLLAKRPPALVRDFGVRLSSSEDLEARTELLCMLFLNKYPFHGGWP